MAALGYVTFLETMTRGQVIFMCPRPLCERVFVGVYETAVPFPSASQAGLQPEWKHTLFLPSEFTPRQFEQRVQNLSPQFTEIYRQSALAEYHGLVLICGPGYRKALEFLLKDFLKSVHTDDEVKSIEKLQLGPLINNYVTDVRLKAVASRAVWLGNDETHYVRKWEDKELNDLKTLIELTIHWISMDILTREFEQSMPVPEKGK